MDGNSGWRSFEVVVVCQPHFDAIQFDPILFWAKTQMRNNGPWAASDNEIVSFHGHVPRAIVSDYFVILKPQCLTTGWITEASGKLPCSAGLFGSFHAENDLVIYSKTNGWT